MSKRRTGFWLMAAGVVLASLVPSYVRAYRVGGPSDAPTYLLGDLIFVNHAAYDLRWPYTDVRIFSLAEPQPGDVVMFQAPEPPHRLFKRVAGGPGDTLSMAENHLTINRVPLEYVELEGDLFYEVPEENCLGSIIEQERGNGPDHPITYTPGAGPYASFSPIKVPSRHYFLIGDNRDKGFDSRQYGSIHRDAIRGKVIPKGRR